MALGFVPPPAPAPAPFALVDANNFYVSCERVFDYRLLGRPVVVLSNNDGKKPPLEAHKRVRGLVRVGGDFSFPVLQVLLAETVATFEL